MIEGDTKKDPLLGGDSVEVPMLAIYMVFLTQFMDVLAGSISTPVMPYYARVFGASTQSIGYLFAAWSVTSTFFAPFLSRLSDSVGRRPVLIASLIGAGTAAIAQGIATSYWTFFAARAFSGIWAAVGSSCNVYITDVAPDSVRPALLAKLSMIPGLALTFGPGLGGGLSKFGLNVPILVDGAITLVSALLVSVYLPETPAFLRNKNARKVIEGNSGSPPAGAKVPPVIHVLGIGFFLGGIAFSTTVSMFAINMNERYHFDPLHVGFTFVGSALIMIATNAWLTTRIQKAIGLHGAAAFGAAVHCIGLFMFASTSSLYVSLMFFYMGAFGNTIRTSTGTAIVGSCTDTSNRGKIFGIMATYMNCGRMVGPLMGGHLAQVSVDLPFQLASCAALGTAILFLVAQRMEEFGAPRTCSVEPALRKVSEYGEAWQDEVGRKEDIDALGIYMSNLLTQRHYRWVSRRAEIQSLLEKLLPPLDTGSREEYMAEFDALEKASHAMQARIVAAHEEVASKGNACAA